MEKQSYILTNCQARDILIAVATDFELSRFAKIADLRICVTGIGLLSTAIALYESINEKRPQCIIQVGICGAIDKSIALGETVIVKSDFVADTGAWRGDDKKFIKFGDTIYNGVECDLPYRKVSGRSVSIACNNLFELPYADVESMEGAALFAVAQKLNIPAVQIRTVSNYLDTPRNEWKIDLAIENLANVLKNITFGH